MSYLRHIKATGMTLVAMLVFCGIAAGSAVASTPTFETASGEFEVPFTLSGDGGALETIDGHRVECSDTKGGGEISTATHVREVALTFEGCADPNTGVACTTDNQSGGTIVAKLAQANLVYTGDGKNIAALWVWPESGTVMAEFSCQFLGIGPEVTAFATVEETKKGGFVCPITPVNQSTTVFTIDCKQEGGMQQFKSYWNGEECEELVPDWFESEGVGFMGWGRQESALEGEVTTTTDEPVTINSSECI